MNDATRARSTTLDISSDVDRRDFITPAIILRVADAVAGLREAAPHIDRAVAVYREVSGFLDTLLADEANGRSIEEYGEILEQFQIKSGTVDLDYILGSFYHWILRTWDGDIPTGGGRRVAESLTELDALSEGWMARTDDELEAAH